jgi:hypothetical protein
VFGGSGGERGEGVEWGKKSNKQVSWEVDGDDQGLDTGCAMQWLHWGLVEMDCVAVTCRSTHDGSWVLS